MVLLSPQSDATQETCDVVDQHRTARELSLELGCVTTANIDALWIERRLNL